MLLDFSEVRKKDMLVDNSSSFAEPETIGPVCHADAEAAVLVMGGAQQANND